MDLNFFPPPAYTIITLTGIRLRIIITTKKKITLRIMHLLIFTFVAHEWGLPLDSYPANTKGNISNKIKVLGLHVDV